LESESFLVSLGKLRINMVKETPVKVLSLLVAAIASMSFLFAVSWSNASLAYAENPLPDPFAVENIMASLDKVAAGYDSILTAYLYEPVKADWALVHDNTKWVIDNSADPILAMTGLTDLASVEYYQALDYAQVQPRVAGAYVQAGEQQEAKAGGFSMDSLYSLLIAR
jgi:hypothetical protein